MTNPPDPMPVASPKVLFIAGYGRSGSTLLDMVLGTIDGFVSTGELSNIWKVGARSLPCACGHQLPDCPLWGAVLERAFPGIGIEEMAELEKLTARAGRLTRIPTIATGREAADVSEYLETRHKLYQAIQKVSGASVIVESTKWPTHGYALKRLGDSVRPYFLHVVRDSRAVAYSMGKRLWDQGKRRYRDEADPLRASLGWLGVNLLVMPLATRDDRFRFLRYERFASDPAATVAAIVRFLGEEAAVPVDASGVVELGENHCVAGNLLRFDRGSTTIRLDDDWIEKLPPRAKATVSATTWPLLRMYGYTGRRASASA